jgi:hypothetical protein
LAPKRLLGRDLDAADLGRHEGAVAVDDGPRSLVQPEVVAAGLAQRRRVLLQRSPQRLVAGPALAQLQGVDDLRGFDQFFDGDAVALRELAGVGGQVDRREAPGHRVQFGDRGRAGFCGGVRGGVGSQGNSGGGAGNGDQNEMSERSEEVLHGSPGRLQSDDCNPLPGQDGKMLGPGGAMPQGQHLCQDKLIAVAFFLPS